MPALATQRKGPASSLPRPWHRTPAADLAARLERLGIWDQPAFRGYTDADRVEFLAARLAGDAPGQGPHLPPEIDELLNECVDEYHDALNEDLSRILLGERLHRQAQDTWTGYRTEVG